MVKESIDWVEMMWASTTVVDATGGEDSQHFWMNGQEVSYFKTSAPTSNKQVRRTNNAIGKIRIPAKHTLVEWSSISLAKCLPLWALFILIMSDYKGCVNLNFKNVDVTHTDGYRIRQVVSLCDQCFGPCNLSLTHPYFLRSFFLLWTTHPLIPSCLPSPCPSSPLRTPILPSFLTLIFILRRTTVKRVSFIPSFFPLFFPLALSFPPSLYSYPSLSFPPTFHLVFIIVCFTYKPSVHPWQIKVVYMIV